ncbi:hypothetical protein [Mycobacterium sp. DL99]|uniref:hypothetical protein n=1 Tax=Mycobacterium sp. DL99 TaxID=2528957 RepID=UPI001081FC13|nr:hypothetical protein [Mycobacterium sp. DL99]
MTTEAGFQIRAPWYVRESGTFGLRDARSLRPSIQMYSGSDFVDHIMADASVYLTPKPEDYWGYPVPVSPFGTGRSRLSTYKMMRTKLRKLFQPNHDRFYAVTVEVFCDQPGLPRAGGHDDIQVSFAMRRQVVSFADDGKSVRKLAAALVSSAAKVAITPDMEDPDLREVWWSDKAAGEFAAQNRLLIDAVTPQSDREAWVKTGQSGEWKPCDGKGPIPDEQTFTMWRLPARKDDCAAAGTRSLWFGIIPTYSSDHGTSNDGKDFGPKLDEHGIYEIVAFVTRKPARGHEHCPPKIWFSTPSEPFKLAAPMDPDGTKNRVISISVPDFRALAARAGQPMGPGGLRISTPPRSQMVFNPLGGIPKPKQGNIGAGGGICFFAFELFFIVALFLFLMFMPIIVFAFQLWWMLALRFCIPPSISFSALATAAAKGELDIAANADLRFQVELAFGAGFIDEAGTKSTGWYDAFKEAKPAGTERNTLVSDVALAADPAAGVIEPPAPPGTDSLKDPLCGR